MSRNLTDITNSLAYVSNNITMLDMLLEFERTLDNTELYAYKNWISGELVEGPTVERYWVTCKFMYPYKMMPDPAGGLRLEKIGCKIKYDKDKLKVPMKVKDHSSYTNPNTKRVRLKVHPVWIVTIRMPRHFIDERILDDIEAANNVSINTDDISAAYDGAVEDVTDLGTGDF